MAESEGVPLRIHRAAERLGAGGGGASGSKPRRGPRRPSIKAGCARPRPRWRAASSTCRSPASGPASTLRRGAAGSLGTRGLPVPRPGAVRRRPRRVLLRPRAAGRRARRPPGRLDPARGRRPVGQRQVLGCPRRPSAGARRRRPSRLRALAAGADAPRRAAAGGAVARPGPGGARGGTARARRRSPTRSSGSPDGERLVLLTSISSRRSSPPAATRPSARRSSTRWSRVAADPDERLVVVLAIRADFYGRCAEHAGALDAGERQPRPGRADAPRRAAPGDRASRPPGGAAGRAAAGLGAGRRRRRRARRPAAALHRPGRALAGARAAAPCATRPTSEAAASTARSRASPSDAYGRLSPAERLRARRAILLRLVGADDEQAEAVRPPPRSPRRARARARRGRRPGPRRAHREPPGHRRRGHGRGRPRGAAARMAAPARLARRGRRGPPASPAPDRRRRRVARLRARPGRALPRRPARLGARLGGRATTPSSTSSSARSSTRAGPRASARPSASGAPTAACGRCSPGSACCSPPPWSPG